MKMPEMVEAAGIALSLEQLAAKLAKGEIPDPIDAIKVLSSALVAFTDDVESLRPHLSDAARAREDYFVDLAARMQLGPRPK